MDRRPQEPPERAVRHTSVAEKLLVTRQITGIVSGLIQNRQFGHEQPSAPNWFMKPASAVYEGGKSFTISRLFQAVPIANVQSVSLRQVNRPVHSAVGSVPIHRPRSAISGHRPVMSPRARDKTGGCATWSAGPSAGRPPIFGDHAGRLLGDHDRRRVGVAAGDGRHDRGIDHP